MTPSASPPLTANERELALAAWASGAHCRGWGNLVLEAYDAVEAERVILRVALRIALDSLEAAVRHPVLHESAKDECRLCLAVSSARDALAETDREARE